MKVKVYVAIAIGQLRRDYLVDAEPGPNGECAPHEKIAAARILAEKPRLTREEKTLNMHHAVRLLGMWRTE